MGIVVMLGLYFRDDMQGGTWIIVGSGYRVVSD